MTKPFELTLEEAKACLGLRKGLQARIKVAERFFKKRGPFTSGLALYRAMRKEIGVAPEWKFANRITSAYREANNLDRHGKKRASLTSQFSASKPAKDSPTPETGPRISNREANWVEVKIIETLDKLATNHYQLETITKMVNGVMGSYSQTQTAIQGIQAEIARINQVLSQLPTKQESEELRKNLNVAQGFIDKWQERRDEALKKTYPAASRSDGYDNASMNGAKQKPASPMY